MIQITQVSPRMDNLDDNWDLDTFEGDKASAWAAPVASIHICALRNELNEGDEYGSPPTNHWTLCLETTPTSSVMLDMAPGYGEDGLRGKIEVRSLDRPYTDETLRAFSFRPAATGTTVGRLLEHTCEKGRQKFTFHPSWEGCRFWISVLLADWEACGIVDVGSAHMAREALLKYWVNPEGSQPREMREGIFRT